MDTKRTPSKSALIDRVFNVSESRAKYLAKVTWIDRVVAATILKLVPASVTPNQITLFRFATIPIIITLFLTGRFVAGTALFLFSAFSDMLDGALARTTNHITMWGIICDPLADKLLIGSVSLILVTRYVSGYLALAIVAIELTLMASAYYRYKGRVVPAKLVGKIKMILQCVGIIFILFYVLFSWPGFLIAAKYTLYTAVAFAISSLVVYRSI